ncbi:MAG: serine protease [Gemmataceae bacterium]
MQREDLIKVGKGAAIAAAGAVLTYVTQWVSGGDFGSYTPMIVAVWSIVANAARKWIIPTAAVLLAIMTLHGPAFAAPPRLNDAGPPAIKAEPRARSIAESSVYISVDHGGGRSAGGTGTVIAAENGKSLVLTNAHVVPSGIHPIAVSYFSDGAMRTSPATYLGGSSVDDIGPTLIRVNGPDLALLLVAADLQPVEIADAIPAPGEAVSLYGFGGSVEIRPTLKTGHVLRENNWRTTAGDPIARTSIETVNGDSGSGIFNDRGQLVAVHWGAGAVRLDTVHAFTVQILDHKPLFPKLRAKLVARKLSKAIAAAFAAPVSAPEPKPAPPTVKAEPPIAAAACPNGVCTTTRRGFRRR